ncbi:MAG: zf-HC2 domain-containing protein [Chthonomonadales bacterium]|nr:zf-HC2 domain-containing protein [Chthonomonadales bacterium]
MTRSPCRNARALLPAYVAGELTEREQRLVRSHLDRCGACGAEEGAMRGALSLLAARAPRAAPPDLWAGLQARIDLEAPRRPGPTGAPRWALGAACALLVALTAWATISVGRVGPTSAAVGPARQPLVALVVEPVSPSSRLQAADANAPAQAREAGPSAALPAQAEPRSRSGPAPPAPERAEAEPSPARRARRAPRRQRLTAAPPPAPSSFLDVRDASGRSARDVMRLAEARRIDRAARADARELTRPEAVTVPAPMAEARGRRPVVFVEVPEERVRVGDRVMRVRGESGWDARGQLAVIRVRAEARAVPDGAQASPAHRDE